MNDRKVYLLFVNIILISTLRIILVADIGSPEKLQWCAILSIGILSANTGTVKEMREA